MAKKEISYTENSIIVGDIEIPLDDIILNVNKCKIQNRKLCLLKLEWGSSRNFDGAYEYKVLPLENALKFKEIFTGFEVYFGEIAGKHSDIYGILESDEIVIETNEDKINEFLTTFPEGIDYNHSFLSVISDRLMEMDTEEVKEYISWIEFDKLMYI